MLSISAIDRALEQRDYDRLLRDLSRNGLIMPLPLRVQLAESAAGARGLGLRRLVELTYGPTALTRQIIADLIRGQLPTGAVADAAGRASCLLTAAFASGLSRVLRDHGDMLGDDRPEIQAAYQHALAALAAMQAQDGLFAGPQDRNRQARLLTSAFIAYLLIDAPAFAAVCHGHALLTALEDQLDRCEPATEQLVNMARLARLMPAPEFAPESAPHPATTIAAAHTASTKTAAPRMTQPNLLSAA